MNNSNVVIKEIQLTNKKMLSKASDLISEYSWGKNYPVSPISEIEKSEHRVGAFVKNKLIGFSSVGFGYSPDQVDNDQVWFGHAVMIPAFRKQGIFKKMYKIQMAYAKSKFKYILTCSSNPIIQNFLMVNGWREVRKRMMKKEAL